MATRVLRIRTDRPLLWRTPSEFQIGLDSPHTTVTDVPDHAAPLLQALRDGVSDSGLSLLAKHTGLSPDQQERLVEQLRPACEPQQREVARSIALIGTSQAVPAMVEILDACGIEVTRYSDIHEMTSPPADGIILVADYQPHPDWIAVLGSLDITHTPVVFSDLTISIGPQITPGHSPCLACLDAHHRARTPHWLNIHSQLWGTASPLATVSGGAIAALYAAAVHSLLPLPGVSDPPVRGRVFRYRPGAGSIEIVDIDFDDQCTCRGL